MVLVLLLPLVASCSPGGAGQASASLSPAPTASMTGEPNLQAAAAGVCSAIAALPDAGAAERTFTNDAHEALHALAAAPGLDRSVSARLLESMEQVEADFEGGLSGNLGDDLGALHAAADAALAGIGQGGFACP
jgi:hypothetical protein